MELAFHKFQAIGNDYILFDAIDGMLELSPKQIRHLCDRRLGIGADGILILTRAKECKGFNMEILNADGSVAKMCGNGLRSCCKYLVDQGHVPLGEAVPVQTRSGLLGGIVLENQRRTSLVTATIGKPTVREERCLLVGEPFAIVDVGNLHAVRILDSGSPRTQALEQGPLVEEAWPGGINVGYCTVTAPDTLELAVWERGAGFTQACGTGATAAGFWALQKGVLDCGRIVVRQVGGVLTLDLTPEGEVFLSGEVEHVFSGIWRQDV